jgi:DNA-binding transcriptional LysR family regulator
MACRRDHPLAKRTKVRWSELSKYDYISVGKASGNRLLLSQALSGVKGQPQTMFETQHVTTAIGLVEAGLGIAAVPAMAMPAENHPLLVSVPLYEPVVNRKMGLIRRRSAVLSPTAQQLYDLCTECRPKS